MWVKMNRVIEAVRLSVPESMSSEIVRKLVGVAERAAPLHDQIEATDDDEAFDPVGICRV